MNQEKQPHWILVAFGTAVITALVNNGVALLSLLWSGIVRLSWVGFGILAVSVLVESVLLFGVFVLGIRYTIVTFGSLILALIDKQSRPSRWTDRLERMIWKIADLLIRAIGRE